MSSKLSNRLAEIVAALPLTEKMRVLEIGCGPGAMAREITNFTSKGFVLGIDRSEKAIQQAIAGSSAEIKAGKLAFRKADIEQFELESNEQKFDLAIAVRVGALDGRHPDLENLAIQKIRKALKENGKLFIDGGNPIKEIKLNG